MQNFALIKSVTPSHPPFYFVKFTKTGFTCPSGKRAVLPLSKLGGKVVERFNSKKECDNFIRENGEAGRHYIDVFADKYK